MAIEIGVLVLSIIYVVFAILILWKTSLLIIETKNMSLFLSFVFVSVAICFAAAFTFHSIFIQWFWMFVELLFVLFLLWVLAILRRKQW